MFFDGVAETYITCAFRFLASSEAILNNSTPPVTIYDGYNALQLAYLIMEKMAQNPDNI